MCVQLDKLLFLLWYFFGYIFFVFCLFVVVKNSPLFLYWQRYHVHSTYSEQYHRNQHSKMLSLSATLHLKDSHALHHEICCIMHKYIGSICIFLYIYIYMENIYFLWYSIWRFHIVGSSQDIYVYIFLKYINFIFFLVFLLVFCLVYFRFIYIYFLLCGILSVFAYFTHFDQFWVSGANNTRISDTSTTHAERIQYFFKWKGKRDREKYRIVLA